jgi:uncharacterized phage-associated protein
MTQTAPPNRRLSAMKLAEHILWLRRAEDTTPRGLIKLAYLSHAWSLGINGHGLVDEDVVTGRFGPIFQSLDDELAILGTKPVTPDVVAPEDQSERLDDVDADVVKLITRIYGELPDARLSALTHMPETPWSRVHAEQGIGAVIPTEAIQEHYSKLLAADAQ